MDCNEAKSALAEKAGRETGKAPQPRGKKRLKLNGKDVHLPERSVQMELKMSGGEDALEDHSLSEEGAGGFPGALPAPIAGSISDGGRIHSGAASLSSSSPVPSGGQSGERPWGVLSPGRLCRTGSGDRARVFLKEGSA